MDLNSSLLADSLGRLRVAIVPNCGYVIFGFFAIISNGLIIFCISKSKSLHTKCFALLACNASVDFLLGISYVAAGAIRLYRYNSGIGEVISMWRCCCEASVITFAQMISLSMSAILVIDRLTSTLLPHPYSSWSYKRFTIPLVMAALVYAAVQSTVHFIDSWNHKDRIVLTCGIEDTITDHNLSILIAIQITTSVIIVAANIFLVFVVRKRSQKIRQAQIQTPSLSAQFEQEKRELKIFKTITVIIVMHILTHMGSRLILAVVKSLASDVGIQSLTSRYTRLLVLINAAIHFLILYSTSSDFRAAVKAIACTQVTSVTTFTNNS